ncbi:MAG: depupylase/deamidase Dop [Acidimicrobiia bacterium]
MAIRKVCGVETEYGILVRGGESNPVAASSVLINAYVNDRRVDWDFEDESPGVDARGFSYEDALAPEVESHLVNAVLTNGARYYVDHAHPEISTPECSDAAQALVFDRAAEEIVRRSMALAAPLLPVGAELLIHKNNSDGKGNSYGCHENFLVDRETPFGRLVAQIIPHFVTRQVFCGAGKVGSEAPGHASHDVDFQISQRADFFEEEVGLETTLKRPIVNTRDEPHCDPQKYRRLHVIVGDANMSEGATLLKLGTTSLVLGMIEDGFLDNDLALAHPVPAIRQISHDPSLTRTVLMQDGRRLTALDIQWSLLERANLYVERHGYECVGEETGRIVLGLWSEVLDGLAVDRSRVADLVDWVAKERLLDAYSARHSIPAHDSRLRAIDLQYHDMRPGKCLADKVGLRRFATPDDVRRAVDHPPETTRAYFRGECLRRWPDHVVAANWDSMVFDVGRDPLRRVPMMEPLRGTRSHVGELLDTSTSVSDLLERLGS